MYAFHKNKSVFIVSLLLIVTGFAEVTNLLLNIPLALTIFPKYVYLKFNSALCLILLGSALVLTQFENNKKNKFLYFTLSISITLVAVITLAEYQFHFNAGIDQLFFDDKLEIAKKDPFPGRMAIQVAFGYALFGVALLGYTYKNLFINILSQYALHLVTIISSVAIISYFYNFSFLQHLQSEGPMALIIPFLFFFTSVAASFLHPSLGITSLFSGDLVGNRMARRLFLLMVFTIVIFGLIRVQSLKFKLFSYDTSFSLLTICLLLASLAIIRHTALWLNKNDLKRYEAEKEIKSLNEKLGSEVEKRTAELMELLKKYSESELKFRMLAEKSLVGVYISQGKRFTYVNPRFAEIFGYEPYELIDTAESAVNTIISEKDQSTVWENVQARYKGEIDNIHYEVTGKKKDGTFNDVEFYGNRVIIDGEPSIIGTMLDVTERKRAEELILREKTLSDTIINSLPEVFYLRNVKGEFLRWNKNFEKLTGYTPEEIKKSNNRALIAEEDREMVKKAVEKMLIEGFATVEAKIISKNDVRVPFLITIAPIVYENQDCVLGIAIDISSRIKAEEELKSSEMKYKMLFESNPQPLSMIAKDDLSIIAVNEAFAKQYGYVKDELLQMSASVLRPEPDRQEQLAVFKKDFSGSNDIGVMRHLRKDGSDIFVHVIAHDIIFEGRPVRLSLTTDVTEKLRSEEMLQKSEANLRTILDTTETAYALLDKDLKITAHNQMAVKFINNQYHQFPAEAGYIADHLPEEKFSRFIKHVDDVLQGKNIAYEICYAQQDSSLSWFNVRLFPITNDRKEILGLMLELSDITERKNTEESLKTAYQQIQNQISSIKDMAWKQSHLIRGPVANLKGLAALLYESPSDFDLLRFINIELERVDKVIIEMAEDAGNHET